MSDSARSLDAPEPQQALLALRVGAAWSFRILARIANFAALRRHLGCPRADTLVLDIAARLHSTAPSLRIASVARDVVEIAFEGETQDDLHTMLAVIRIAGDAPFDLDGEEHRIHLLFGAAAAPTQRAEDVRLIEEAEAALQEAQAVERAVTHAFGDESNAEIHRLARELDVALERDELLLQYQPKIHVRQQRIGSAEALVRWRHPERGLVLPGDFIPAAEVTNRIGAMTLWTIRQVIEDQRVLIAKGHDLRLFINISGQLLADADFVREACALVVSSGAKLGFEVTETSVIRDPASAIANLHIFAGIGIVVAIDDYGAGLSSLAYLKQLPARELKIDKLFVTQLTSSNRDPLIVRSTIDLAHALEMEVVAEGVETHAALALLTVMGCDMIQGFLISRPIALEALMTFLEEDRHGTAPEETRASFNRLASGWSKR